MSALPLHDFHKSRAASFIQQGTSEAVSAYGSFETEYDAMTRTAALIDLSFRGRVCLIGADREKFLHGQVTNDVARLKVGDGCYAALVTAKGKMESDLFIFKLSEELVVDLEPGLTERVIHRLNRYIIAEDVQVLDVSPHYGLLHAAGPSAAHLLQATSLPLTLPSGPLQWTSTKLPSGDLYLMNNPRFGVPGFDLFVPVESLEEIAAALEQSGESLQPRWVGLNAAEVVRIENGIPRYGIDMTESTLPQEAEIQEHGVSFSKGCYIGQEIIARIRTYGQVAKALRVLRFAADPTALPAPGQKLLRDGKEVGTVTAAVFSPKYRAPVGMGYVRKEVNSIGNKLRLDGESHDRVEIISLPWNRSSEHALNQNRV